MEKQTSVSSPMTKDLLMKYTFAALCVVAATAIIAFGIAALIMIIISVAVALISDYLVSLFLKKKGLLDIYSSAVSGIIVALSFSSGIPYTTEYIPTMDPNIQYIAVAVISAVAIILFKKIQGLLGRKYLNPVAVAKLLVLAPIWSTALMPKDHLIVDISSFSTLRVALEACYSSSAPFKDSLLTLVVLKNHGWLGGASSIAVIAVGIALILLSRGYIKWRIPLTYLATIAIFSASYGFINGEDIIIRVAYHLFVGSVIFLAFFMATDPATTPLTSIGQIIFAVGLGILTMVFQLYFLFLGGSILALIIMNLTTPILDKIGLPKPSERKITRKLPKAKKFETAKVTKCIRCGKCLVSCCMNLSPILIKEASDKGNWVRVKNLKAEYCDACGHCSYVCPSMIDLKGIIIFAKQKIQKS